MIVMSISLEIRRQTVQRFDDDVMEE